jgi:hypothetical protein
MRIIITENQYRTILKENKMDRFVDTFIEENRTTPMDEVIDILFSQYGFTVDIIARFDNLENYFSKRLFVNLNLKSATGKIHFLREIINSTGYKLKDRVRDFIENTIQGLLDNVVDEVLAEVGGDFRKATKKLSDVMKILPRRNNLNTEFFDMVKDRAEQEGYTLVRKGYGDMGWTFEKGGGRIQQIIDYIKEQPKLPQKTRKGWQLYVGEDPNREGWMSTLWRVVQDAGIVEKVRDGRTFTYRLGPNAEAFEQGKLIGF